MTEGRGTRVLVIDDDRACCQLIADVLRDAGHQVRMVQDPRQAIATAETWRPDVVVLDVIMPFVDGISLCVALRERVQCAILMVSAKGDAADRTVGLRVGADDYLAKPFDTTEIEARVEALLRRQHSTALEPERRIGALTIDRRAKRVMADGRTLDLTPTEFRLLEHLTERLGSVVTRDELLAAVWNGRISGPSRAVDVHVGRLRRKLESAGVRGVRLHARRGFGYVATAGGPLPLAMVDSRVLAPA